MEIYTKINAVCGDDVTTITLLIQQMLNAVEISTARIWSVFDLDMLRNHMEMSDI